MKCDVLTLENKKVGSIDLADGVFGSEVRKDIISRMVNWQLAKRRSGNHKTKNVSEIRGTTAKPWNQKGTGRARAGTVRSTQFRGGATVFGPVVRDHGHKLPRKVRRMALRSALSSKQAEGKLKILDVAKLDKPKTKDLAAKLSVLGWSNVLIVAGAEVDGNLALAAANIANVDVLPQQGVNVYDIIRREILVLTKDAAAHLQERLS
ncbi:MAG: 50S ribosomal protein L4 [Pseudomonadota bacterium]|nr:50S ribosomal protein L4 [Pseudomonadota bacterium]MEC8289699.1 50S ribosomal protein L4 [Pseudomonadota bacterium]MEC8532100.1 50S ribosomal protein L4 [Pseudomonadota bacterium]MEC8725754.1 50S ribosomal protein L4 [Pseudomonadota bacterium]MEC9207432.1 50S ribosomal protein L4 [Pseudomonadota bacterium]